MENLQTIGNILILIYCSFFTIVTMITVIRVELEDDVISNLAEKINNSELEEDSIDIY